MKKMILLVCALLITATLVQARQYPFKVGITGKGKNAIVFIPGFTCSGAVYNETLRQFEGHFTCYTLTMAGFAGVPPQDSASFAYWEHSIAGFIQDNKLGMPIIVGHSMGGGLALAIAADYPALVKSIVVIDALPCLQAMQNPAFKQKQGNDCSALVAMYKAMPDSQFYASQKMTMRSLMSDTTKTEEVVSWAVKSDRETFATMYCDFINTDLRDRIAAIKCPALILLEPYFANFKPAIEGQYQKLATAQLHYAGKGLHFIMYDDKDWYDTQLKNFIQ